jgi:hypothetical protein
MGFCPRLYDRIEESFGALNAEMFVGVCFAGGSLLLGILGAQLFYSRKAASKKKNN